MYTIITITIVVLSILIIALSNFNFKSFTIKKADDTDSPLNFSYLYSKITRVDGGYKANDEEKAAMNAYLLERVEEPKNSIASYFNLCHRLDMDLKTMACPSFVKSELAVGFGTLIFFIAIALIGINFC